MGMFEGAARRRRAAELERRLAELDAWDRRYGLGGAPPGHPAHRPDTTWRHHSPDGVAPLRALDPAPRALAHRPRRRRGRGVLALLAVGTVAAAVALPAQRVQVQDWAAQAARSVMGLPEQETAGDGGGTARGDRALDEIVQRWTPPADTPVWGWEPPRGTRVRPPVEATTSGSYVVLQTQPGTDVPVGFSPCGPVGVVVNPASAPPDHTELVQASLGRLGAASGLELLLVGETDDVWTEESRDLGAPVLVSWSDPATVPLLDGPTVGLGGATTVSGPDGVRWHATGQVVLDSTALTRWEQHASVLDHELAHVLGLDHVDDPGELMAAVSTTGRAGFGPGDLQGLAALGAIPCPGE